MGLGGTGYRYNMTFSPMALNNLNNPYSPQPSTPISTMEGEMPLGLLEQQPQQVVVQQSMQQRSRHSSAESEPALRLMSPAHLGGNGNGCLPGDPSGDGQHLQQQQLMEPMGGGRQRHASAGQAANVVVTGVPQDWLSGAAVGGGKSDFLLKSESANFDGNLNSSSLFGDDDPASVVVSTAATVVGAPPAATASAAAGGKKSDNNLPDDLDMALSALKDCDNEFSKFVEETEDTRK